MNRLRPPAPSLMRQLIAALALGVFLSGLPLAVQKAAAHNPFTAAPETRHAAPPPPVKSRHFVQLITWQQELRQKMAGLIRKARTEKKTGPLVILALSAFLYGVIHSAGPGHGKAVALSYILSCRPGLGRGVLFGNILALTHGCSGIFLVLGAVFIFNTAVSASLETVTRATQLVSFSLITVLGLLILGRSLFSRRRSQADAAPSRLYARPFLTAFTVGLVPCPGVVMVMIFSISLGMTWLGILLGGIIALGMATTVTLIILAGMSGKAALLAAASRKGRPLGIAERLMEGASGILVAGLGLMLLASVL